VSTLICCNLVSNHDILFKGRNTALSVSVRSCFCLRLLRVLCLLLVIRDSLGQD
jgi:hypothetical protein